MNIDDEMFKANFYSTALPVVLHDMKSANSMLRNEISDITRLIEHNPATKNSANVKDTLSRMMSIAKRLNESIDYLRTLTRAPNSHIQTKPISIKQFERLVQNEMRLPEKYFRSSQKFRFKSSVADSNDLYVLGDTGLITVVFMNLFLNAINHSIPNTEIITNFDLSDSTVLKIDVSNICETQSLLEIDKFFDPGFRSIESYNYSNGAGFGLTMVSKICHELNYKVTLSSFKTDTKTSRFQVSVKIPTLNK